MVIFSTLPSPSLFFILPPPPFFSLTLLFSPLGFLSFSGICCSFFRLFLCSRTIWSRFSFISLSWLFLFSYGLSLGFPISQLLSSCLPLHFSSSTVCIHPPCVLSVRLSSAGGSFSLVSPYTPSPSSAGCLSSLRLSFFSSGLPPIHFFISFSFLASSCCLGFLSLSFSFSCLFSLLGDTALLCCLSLLVHLRLWYSVRMLRLRFFCAGVGGVSGVVHFL